MGIRNPEHGGLLPVVDLQRVLVPGSKSVPGRQVNEVRRHAGDGMELPTAPVQGRQGLHQSPGIGVPGIVIDLLRRADLHDLSGVHDGDPVGAPGNHPQIVGNQNGCSAQLLLDIPQKVQNLGLNGHVQCGGGLVRQQDPGIRRQSDGHHRPLPHTAGKGTGQQGIPLLRAGNAHQLHQAQHPGGDLLPGKLRLVDADRLGDLRPDGDRGIQGSEGVLKDHGEELSPKLLHVPVRIPGNVHAVCHDPPAVYFRGLGQQLHDGAAEHGFSAARLSHDGQHLAGAKGKAHVPHRPDLPGGRVNGHRQVFNSQQFIHARTP